MKKVKFEDLVKIMERLRGNDGCPWDKEQNRKSLKPYLIEESYEVLEAIDEGNPEKIKEELGDLLFQILFHTQISKDMGEFDINDVIEKIHEKMIRRHPHVFNPPSPPFKTSLSPHSEGGDTGEVKGGEGGISAKDALAQWEDIKSKEKGYEKRKSVLDGVPKELPSLLMAHRLQDKAARVGFDWEHIDQVFAKVEEEMNEFREAFSNKNTDEMENELGDLLFALVNIARFIEVNPEDALRKTISRFIKRFHYIEEEIARQGRELRNVSMEEMDKLWNEAKLKES
ncbi:MAG: nucleoside triphosphate pyrophosphohydrolase [Nitrospinae bacterium]|nr:nucleoside triphosphate pyrophosphohydrolase [Nitrospinota bacterium]MBI3814146.1 nucleoside triphosphate pyrophosphohydrolase [Nitrospinota bacterium]